MDKIKFKIRLAIWSLIFSDPKKKYDFLLFLGYAENTVKKMYRENAPLLTSISVRNYIIENYCNEAAAKGLKLETETDVYESVELTQTLAA